MCSPTKIPEYWTDHLGQSWLVPQILGRLRCGKCPGHRALREFVIFRDGGRCQSCGLDDPLKLIADHIVSRRNGGSHHPKNLQCLCESCNATKSNLVDRKGHP